MKYIIYYRLNWMGKKYGKRSYLRRARTATVCFLCAVNPKKAGSAMTTKAEKRISSDLKEIIPTEHNRLFHQVCQTTTCRHRAGFGTLLRSGSPDLCPQTRHTRSHPHRRSGLPNCLDTENHYCNYTTVATGGFSRGTKSSWRSRRF